MGRSAVRDGCQPQRAVAWDAPRGPRGPPPPGFRARGGPPGRSGHATHRAVQGGPRPAGHPVDAVAGGGGGPPPRLSSWRAQLQRPARQARPRHESSTRCLPRPRWGETPTRPSSPSALHRWRDSAHPPPPPNCDAHKIGWVRPTDRAAAERGTSRFPKSRLSLGGGGGVAGMEHEGCAPAEGPGQVGLEEGAGSGRAPSYTVRGVLNRPRSRWPSARSARVLWRSRWEKEHERMGVAPFACKVHAVLVASRHFWPYPTRGHRRQGLGVKAFPAPPPHLPAHPIECPRHPPWGSPTAPPPPCAGCAMSAVAIDEHAVGAGCTIAVFVCLRKY